MKTTWTAGLVLALGLAAALPASASDTPIFPAGGGELSLSTILDSHFGAGNYVRVHDSGDKWWAGTGFGSAVAIFASKHQELWVSDLSLTGVDPYNYNYTHVLTGLSGGSILPPGQPFQFALWDGNYPPAHGTLFWSDPSTLSDAFNGSGYDMYSHDGLDHMVTFFGTGGAFAGHYIIAFEDLLGEHGAGSDRDFNDLVVDVTGVRPVPEPGTMALLGTGVLGLIGWARRRKA